MGAFYAPNVNDLEASMIEANELAGKIFKDFNSLETCMLECGLKRLCILQLLLDLPYRELLHLLF